MMINNKNMNKENSDTKLREHLANERTFLAWIRTSIALMGLGFVIVKFALFLKELSVIMEGLNISISEGFSAIIGTAMVALGAVLTFFAFLQFKKVESQIDSQNYKPSTLISLFLTIAIVLGGLILVVHFITGVII